MKNIFAAIALCATMAPAIATAQASEVCPMIGGLAESIMTARQRGLSLSDAYELTTESEIATDMVGAAYGETRWHTESAQTRAVQDFRETWELSCYELYGDLA